MNVPCKGVVFQHIDHYLSRFSAYNAFRQGEITPNEYFNWVMQNENAILVDGILDRDMLHLSTRFPREESIAIDAILRDLVESGVIPSANYNARGFAEFRNRVRDRYRHDRRKTYIFPEEERLIYALTEITRAKKVLVLGSYYGYWGVWSVPPASDRNGCVTFVDPDSTVGKLACANMWRLGCIGACRLVNDDGTRYLTAGQSDKYDMIILDAECSMRHPDPNYRGKAVYGPLIECAWPLLNSGGLLVAHNMLLTNPWDEDPYFKSKIALYEAQYHKFLPFVRSPYRFRFAREYETTEGTGVYWK